MKQGLDKIGVKAREVGKSLFLKITVPVTALGAAFVKAASDAEETGSKFATVFKDIGVEAESTANQLAKGFGLSSIKAKELLGDTGDLLTGFGFSGKAALDLAKQTNELAVDLASFTNFAGGAEGASKALTKALLGERESVKSLGISILEEDVKKKVATLTAQGFRFESERQAKAIATLKIAIDQSKNAIGDYERTSASFANRMRVLNARFLDLRIALGKIILPLALKLVNATIKLTEKFTNLNPTIQKIILVVGGLAAVLSPVLIAIGLMIPAMTALMPVIAGLGSALAFLALNPIGLLISALVALLVASKDFRNDLMVVLDFVGGAFTEFWDSMRAPIESFTSFFSDKIGGIIEGARSIGKTVAGFFGDEDTNIAGQNINKNINTNINANQAPLQIGGQLGININGAPKGSSANFVPTPGNQLPVGTNMAYAGG